MFVKMANMIMISLSFVIIFGLVVGIFLFLIFCPRNKLIKIQVETVFSRITVMANFYFW